MTQEDKELLLKDLCARLNTKLVCLIYRTHDQGVGYRDEILHGYCKGDAWYEFYFGEDCGVGIDNVSKIKPYLFPLSSRTDEQKKESPFESALLNAFINGYISQFEDGELNIDDLNRLYDWLNKNHFDYRGLIEKGLAIDATGLNIY